MILRKHTYHFACLIALFIAISGYGQVNNENRKYSENKLEEIADKLIDLSLSYGNTQTERDSAHEAAFEAYKIFKELSKHDKEYFSLCLAGAKAFYGKNSEKGVWCFTECRRLYDEHAKDIPKELYGLNVYDPTHYLSIYYKNISSARYLFYLDKGIEEALKTNNHKTAAFLYNQYTVYYFDIKKPAKALEYSEKAYAQTVEIRDSFTLAISLMNIGDALTLNLDCENADKKLQKAKSYIKAVENTEWKYWILEAIANNYLVWGKLDSSEVYFKKCLKGFLDLNEPNGIAITKGRYARLLHQKGLKELAVKYRSEALEVANQNNLLFISYLVYDNIIWGFEHTNEEDSALIYKNKFILFKDSILNVAYEKQAQSLLKLEEVQNKSRALLVDENNLSLDIENKRNANRLLIIILAGATGMLVFFFYTFNKKHKTTVELRKKNKQIIKHKNLLEKQRELARNQEKVIISAQMDLLSSIEYAKRIQRVMLPTIKELNKVVSSAFVWYQPQNIVSNNIFWTHTSNNKIHIAVGEILFEGVAGAMIGMLTFNNLNKCIREYEEADSAKIIEKFNDLCLETFRRTEQNIDEILKISYCIIDTKTNECDFTGAGMGLYSINNNELNFHAGNNPCIGVANHFKQFKNQKITANKHDLIYFISEGLQQQKNSRDRVFGEKRLKNTLINISKEEMEDQKHKLNLIFNDWKRDVPQTADICVIGIKI